MRQDRRGEGKEGEEGEKISGEPFFLQKRVPRTPPKKLYILPAGELSLTAEALQRIGSIPIRVKDRNL